MFDILTIAETKLDDTYPISVILYVRETIPSKVLRKFFFKNDIEGIFVETNFRKSKWLLCGTYHPPQSD